METMDAASNGLWSIIHISCCVGFGRISPLYTSEGASCVLLDDLFGNTQAPVWVISQKSPDFSPDIRCPRYLRKSHHLVRDVLVSSLYFIQKNLQGIQAERNTSYFTMQQWLECKHCLTFGFVQIYGHVDTWTSKSNLKKSYTPW